MNKRAFVFVTFSWFLEVQGFTYDVSLRVITWEMYEASSSDVA
jgi:hypothetical protein